MRRKFLILFTLICMFGHTAVANDAVKEFITDMKMVGEGRLSKFIWDVYDATLYAPNGTWSYDKPFALSLRYLRDIEGNDIADRSVQEMRGQGFNDEVVLAAWHAQMKAIFPNVKDGTVLTAVFVPEQHTEFFKDKKPIGTIQGDAFRQWFSNIWLSGETSEPELRQKLLGRI